MKKTKEAVVASGKASLTDRFARFEGLSEACTLHSGLYYEEELHNFEAISEPITVLSVEMTTR